MSVCYFPDGTPTLDTPCNRAAQNSHCCPPDSSCLDNGYCFSGPSGARYQNVLARSSCTDPTFQDPSCPHWCSDTNKSGGQILVPYLAAQNMTVDALFCCGPVNYTTATCMYSSQQEQKPFQLANGLIITNRADGSSLPYNESSSTPSASSPLPSLSSTGSHTNTTAVAVGIAVPLGVALIAALAALVIQSRRHRKYRRLATMERDAVGGRSNMVDAKIVPHQTSYEVRADSRAAELGGGLPAELDSARK